ncbi:MAG: TrbI/VirB10 family protein [Rhodoferax sp.]|uniref:TrbI/VirB10 family protein n=1 Tax=Rhodoferax sp. TaxID=50421 RepID=UPI001B5F2F30|nr:TrbI/VirB10 family protein [Rhodoferax sp.]MBP7484504.1 TrbI/VirB10 family protein [Aquabacterium sp.]MBP9906875.1 TrbI/VirB10 family protein [Rhodoferax sp.]
MKFRFGKKSQADDAADIEVAAIDGPGQPLELQPPPPGTKRLSKKGQFLLLGGASTVASAILIGVMISGKRGGDAESQNQLTASDAPGQTAPYKENVEDIQRRATVAAAAIGHQVTLQTADGQQIGPLASRSSNAAGTSGGTGTANGGASPPSPAEAHRLWLQKRKYERLQGQIMASDSAETADISKGGAALAARSGAGGIMDARADVEDLDGGVNQKLSAAHGRAASARATATANAMRMANLPASLTATSSSSGNSPATLAGGGSAALDPAVAVQARNKAFMKEAADSGYLPEWLKPKLGEFELTAGSIIPAVMLSGINSDLPGTIVAQTRQTVYATHDPDTVVIPQGSRLVGRYSADVAFGQSRVLAAWDELILPNGSRISLRGMSAADGQGQSGMEDQVNNHFWKTWSSALLVSFLGVAAQQSQPHNQGAFNTPSGSAQASAAAMNSLSDVSSKILQKSLNISPTLQVRPGMAFNVMVNRSIILPTYR